MTAPRLVRDPAAARRDEQPRQQDPSAEARADTIFEQLRLRIAEARRARPSNEPPLPPADGSGELAAHLDQATALADIGTTVPSFSHLSWPRRLFARASGRALIYLLRVITVDQRHFNQLMLAAIRNLNGDGGTMRRRLDDLDARLDTLGARLDPVSDEIAAAAEHRRTMLVQLAEMLKAVAAEREVLRGQSAAITELRDTTALLLMQTDAVKRLLAADSEAERPAEAGDRRVAPPSRVDSGVDESMRGSLDTIKGQQQRYLPYFVGAADVVDVGCGAGPFLELLRDAGVRAHGVEMDPQLALWCQERGLTVRCMDALEYLSGLEDHALGGLFCAQVVEHFRAPDLLRFVKLAARTLRPGAPIVLETLNPESLMVHYRWFWMNLTHERLVHPQTLSFLLRSHGFRDVKVEYVPPPPGPLLIPPLEFLGNAPAQLDEFNRATQFLNQLLYASFDYAVVGVR